MSQIINDAGKSCTTHLANEKEYKVLLLNKLQEEAEELVKNPCAEEAADIFEVINAIAKLYGFNMEEISRIQKAKRDKRGVFDEHIVLEFVVEEVDVERKNS